MLNLMIRAKPTTRFISKAVYSGQSTFDKLKVGPSKMESLKELMTPKTFNKFSFGVVIVWILFGAILLGIFAGFENSESKLDVYCDDAKTAADKELIESQCFDQYEKEYNKFSIPVYGFVLVNFFVVAIVSVIYSQCVKSRVNQLEANNRRNAAADVKGQIENGNQSSRRLFIAYCCQLAIRFALGILFIALQTQVLYPSNFPSNFECSPTREGKSSAYPLANFTRTQAYECRNQRARNKTFWAVSVAVVNGTFAFLVLLEFIWILSRSRKGKIFMEDSQFFADHLPRQEQQHEQNLQQIPLLHLVRLPQQGPKEQQNPGHVQHESRPQSPIKRIKSVKENIIEYLEDLLRSDHLPRQEQQEQEDGEQQIPLFQQEPQEQQHPRNVQHESRLQSLKENIKDNFTKIKEQLVDFSSFLTG